MERLVPGAHPAVLLRTPEAGAGRSILEPGNQLLFEAESSIGDFRRIGGPKKEREIYINIYTGWLIDT